MTLFSLYHRYYPMISVHTTSSPSFKTRVASLVPITQGIPSSRLTIAATSYPALVRDNRRGLFIAGT